MYIDRYFDPKEFSNSLNFFKQIYYYRLDHEKKEIVNFNFEKGEIKTDVGDFIFEEYISEHFYSI